MPASLHHDPQRRVTRRVGAGLALLAVAAVVAVVVSATSSSPNKRPGTRNSAFDATTVKRRDLVQTDTESGTLSYAAPQTVYNRLSGTLTWLPSVGQVIKPGQALFRVDGKPVILMNGTTPAYRDLTPSDSSAQDIEELNRNLVALGFNPDGIVVDDQWQAATTAGVEALQASLGEAQTGSLSLGHVVFLPGDQLVSTLDATLGSTGGGSGQGNPSGSSNASDQSVGARPEFVSLKNPASPKHGSGHSPSAGSGANNGGQPGANNGGHTGANNGGHTGGHTGGHKPSGKNSMKSLEALIALLQAEVAELKASNGSHGASPSHGGNHGSNGAGPSSNGGTPSSGSGSGSGSGNGDGSGNGNGDGSGSATAILETTSTRQVVTVDLDASKQSEAKVGERVTVEMPAGNTVDGRVSAVSPVAQNSSDSGSGNDSGNSNGNSNNSSGGSGSTIPVTITLARRHTGGGLDQAAVSVSFAQARANNVMSVPVTALLATAGGGYAVQAAAAPHRLIPVTTGLFAAGYVQISGRGIHSGLRVTDSQG